MDYKDLTLKHAANMLARKETSAMELATAALARIRALEPKLHAFLHVSEERALADAKLADERLKGGDDAQILGIPYALKDNILAKDLPLTAGSKILKNYKAVYDATVVRKLSNLNPVLVGKTNLDEFAMGSSTENSAYGPTKNPYDLLRVPGGSSGGSAAAVASGEVLFALGTDTGGSIRQPASFCGVVGLKPTYGRVSRFGAVALGSSLDQIGVFAKTVEDASIAFQAFAGSDAHDTTTIPVPVPDYSKFLGSDLKGLKVGVPNEYFGEGLDPEVKQIIEQAISKFEKMGAVVSETTLPHASYALACYYIILPVEISANLSRYDGIRYGLSEPGQNLTQVYENTRTAGFGEEPKRRIMIGTYASSAGYKDAYYKKAQTAQKLIRRDFKEAFEKFDILLTPTCPTPAFKLGERVADPISMYLADIFTVGLNIAGVPGISIPAGITKSGLPVGLQLIANHFAEEKLFAAGDAFEKINNLKLTPPIS
ncbi:MAG TPA: Asp-tRNA(Asn)/Glu-tRNA(Gln) amidotransferase subunit GatA [Patescibacteria group bacterium]|nr:Asp-tRNA(Asn)/Glu-tRNA(Gln) amidotransferase subunit GatA [Patescibacteria group bacterium]